MLRKIIICIFFILLLTTSTAFADGMLIPTMKGVPPLSVKYQSVSVNITTNVAKTKVVQEFFNNTNRQLEANYVFPLPANASINDFAMYINGKRMSGELVEKKRAREIYEGIVRKMKDPGLLEYIGNNLFRARVFPIAPHSTQKIELEYSNIVAYENNIYTYVYPLKTSMKASRTLEDFTITVDLKSNVPLKNIYSPTHAVGISRKDDYHAVIGFEQNAARLDKDFKLFYTVSEDDIGLNLLTYKQKNDDGYFMLMVAPKTEIEKGEVNKKNIVFTIDTSGSMSGRKIQNAVKALRYCIENLNEQDSFNIVRFSSDVDLLSKKLLPANKDNIKNALDFIMRMRASGGTAIDYSLAESLKLFESPKGTNILVFMTDGLPTVGERNIKRIINNARAGNVNLARVFSFGVGHDVNTMLLDSIASDGKGLSEYLKANDEIEIKLSSFYNKVANPVLSNIFFDFGDIDVMKFYPKANPDIFKGEDLVIIGRYRGHGPSVVKLNGTVNGNKREFVYEGTFAKNDTTNDFIPRLWAVRRVGNLLEEIKLNGEEKELKDEVITLSKEYGIMTPYTSYLVLENEKSYAKYNIPRVSGNRVAKKTVKKRVKKSASKGYRKSGDYESRANYYQSSTIGKALDEPLNAGRRRVSPAPMIRSGEKSEVMPTLAESQSAEIDSFGQPLDNDDVDNYTFGVQGSRMKEKNLRLQSGADAVELSKSIREMKERKVASDEQVATSIKIVKDRRFRFQDGYWTETSVKDEMQGLKIKYLSDAYFNLLKAFPDIKDYVAIGEKVKLLINDKLVIIGEEGEESMSEEKLMEHFRV